MKLWLPILAAAALLAQGVITGNLPPVNKPKFSGLPFPAKFTELALPGFPPAAHPKPHRFILDANGSGVALLDLDNDGLLDILLPASRIFKNEGAGKFTDVTASSGIVPQLWPNGVCAADFDNDGLTDVFLTHYGPNRLFKNLGHAKFADATPQSGLATGPEVWTTGCTFLDYDTDGLLDLATVTYAGFSLKNPPQPGSSPYCIYQSQPVFCGPRGLPTGKVTLYRNLGNGKFADVSEKAGMRGVTGCYGFSVLSADLNADGFPDLYVACDSTPSLYFRNQRNGTFKELGTEAGIAFNEHGAEQAGMGVAIADFDNDGWLDITKTNFIRDYPNLFRNLGKAVFEDIAVPAGLAVNPHYVQWGVGAEDFDNDGLRDIFQVSGHVYPEIESKLPAEQYKNPRILYRNLGHNKFEDVSHLAGPAIAQRHSSRGAAFGDFDNDGDIDAVIMNMAAPPSLLRNDLPPPTNWLKLLLRGTKSNRSAIGATVEIHSGTSRQSAAVQSSSSFLSSNDPRLHFGLGKNKDIDKLLIRWPGGALEEFTGVLSNRLNLLTEGAGKAQPQELPQ